MKIRFTLILFLLLSISEVSAGGWLPGRGKGFFKLGQRFIIANQFYNLNGEIIPISTTSLYITSFYGEYGFSDRWAGILYAPIFFRSTLAEQRFLSSGIVEPGDELNSIGDFDLGIKYRIMQKGSFVLSGSLVLGLPLGNSGGGETGLLQSGDGEFNQLLKVEAGYSFYPSPFYASAGLGVNNRTKDFSDEFRFSGEVGYTPSDKLALIAKVEGVRSFKNGDAAAALTGIFSNNTAYVSYGPEIAYTATKKMGLTGGVFFAGAGRNILARPSYEVGVFLKL